MKGVIASRAPGVPVVDLVHDDTAVAEERVVGQLPSVAGSGA